MTYEEAKARYIEEFGGFPEFLFMGADENEVMPFIRRALDTGREIEASDDGNDY